MAVTSSTGNEIHPHTKPQPQPQPQPQSRQTTDSQGLEFDLTLQRQDFTLQASLQLPARGITILFGPSGSGKTTLLRCIAGLEHAQGMIRFDGQCWQDQQQQLATHRRPIGYVFQEASLFDHLSAGGNLALAERLARSRQRRNGTANSSIDRAGIVDLLGIEPLLQKRPGQLSGGERQRVAIARALLSQPRLLLMDEPLAALDQARKEDILPYLERLKTELAMPVLYVTHSMQEVARLADYLVIMKEGRISTQGTLNEVLGNPELTLESADDSGVVIEGRVAAIDRQWQLARVTLTSGQSLWLRNQQLQEGQMIRARILARDVSLSLEPPLHTSILNSWSAQIVSIHDDKHPAMAMISLTLGTTRLLARTTRKSVHQLDLQPEQQVWVQVKTAGVV